MAQARAQAHDQGSGLNSQCSGKGLREGARTSPIASKIVQANAHTSAWVSNGLPPRCSGDMYNGVPTAFAFGRAFDSRRGIVGVELVLDGALDGAPSPSERSLGSCRAR